MMIYGIDLDGEGRCRHYHTACDVVAPCYQCHEQLRNHPFVPVSVADPAPVLCGSCRHLLTYEKYKKGACPYCHHAFNPKCQLHETIYFLKE